MKIASILNKAVGRQLNSVECCLLIDEAAVTIGGQYTLGWNGSDSDDDLFMLKAISGNKTSMVTGELTQSEML